MSGFLDWLDDVVHTLALVYALGFAILALIVHGVLTLYGMSGSALVVVAMLSFWPLLVWHRGHVRRARVHRVEQANAGRW